MGGGVQTNESPRHRVSIEPFRLARFPVTRGEYAAFVDATSRAVPPCWTDAAFSDRMAPAVGLSWFDAQAYGVWLGVREGFSVGLPTEAQWECAALGGRDGVLYPWGDGPPESLPDYDTRWREGPEPVDRYPSLHPWGFGGLGENVHEWCADWYDPNYYSVSPERTPQGPTAGQRRASRGGSWRHAVKVSRCAARSSIPPHLQYNDYGVRLVIASGARAVEDAGTT